MRTLLTLLAALTLSLAVAGSVVKAQSPAEPSWSADGLTLTLEAGRLYDVDLLPTDALCGGPHTTSSYHRRAAIQGFAPLRVLGHDTEGRSLERNGLRIKRSAYPASASNNEPTARLSGIPLEAGRMAVEGDRRCGRRHHLSSLTIVVTGSLPAAFAPHSLHYGIPLIHHGHAHDPDPALAALQSRVAALEALIDAFDAQTCELVEGRYWDAAKTSRIPIPGRTDVAINRFLGDSRHCCVAASSDQSRADAWTRCSTPAAR